jgi:lysophospholipid acyltransferase (LPLAT)-like uncharacterized protein
MALFHLVSIYKLATMTSTSRDGETVDFMIRKFGGDTSRGSSTRGGVSALKGLIRLCRSGRIASVAVDGPRGPIYQPKPGVFELSKLCHAPIVSVGVTASADFIFKKSWNKMRLPLPFSKVSIYLSEPMEALSPDSNAKDILLANELARRLASARQQAANLIAAP